MATNNTYPATSPYYDTGVFNGKFLDFMVNRPIPQQPSDVLYVIPAVYQYRPDMLAFDLYNDRDCGGYLLLEIQIDWVMIHTLISRPALRYIYLSWTL